MSHGKREQPKIEKYALLSVRDELLALWLLVRHRWYLLALALVVLVGLIKAYDPLGPRTIRMASGQANSTLETLAGRYAEILARHGVRVEKVPSKGAIDSLAMLESGQVDVALSQGGAATGKEQRAIYLTSVGYQPLWFFHRGAAMRGEDLWKFMREHPVSIGQAGSGTRRVFEALLTGPFAGVPTDLRTVELGAAESVNALIEGKIGGMFLLAGAESGNAQALMERADLQVLDFPFAAALAARQSYLEVVTLHRGTLGLSPMRPGADLSMIATTTSLLGTRELHPAIEQLLMRASVEIGQQDQYMFQRAGGFPAMVDRSLPQSEVAARYLKGGPPALESWLPFWLASLLERTWFWLLAFAAIAYPLQGLLPHYRTLMFGIQASYLYMEIFEIYQSAVQASTPEQSRKLRAAADALIRRLANLWVPKGSVDTFAGLMNALDLTMKQVELLEARVAKP
jgi:TRAP-type uncharacterized transport system substrate-binding protein